MGVAPVGTSRLSGVPVQYRRRAPTATPPDAAQLEQTADESPFRSRGLTMIRTLLVPLDGSRFAERALSVAVPLALQHSATIVLTTAFALPPLQHPVAGVLPGEAPTGSAVRDELRAQLERVARRVATKHRVTTATQFREGPIVDELEHAVREANADMVVMASHGRSGASRLWLGSVTDALLRRSSTPLLVTRSARPWTLTSANEPIFPRVLVALDGSPHSERALADALRLIDDYTCEVVLASVHDAPPAPVSSAWAEEAALELRERYLAAPRGTTRTTVAHLLVARGGGFRSGARVACDG